MSNEDLYDNEVVGQDFIADEENDSDEFEVELSRRSPKGDVFLQVFARTRHWLKIGVRPEEIIREDKEPLFAPEEGVRYITFKCNVVLGELEIEMSFSHIEISYQNENGEIGPSTPVMEGDEECAQIKPVFDKVIDHLAAYLSKQ